MEHLAQFVLTFCLGWIAAYSLRKWLWAAAAVFGLFAIPLLALLFFAGAESAIWNSLGAGLSLLLIGLLNGLQSLFGSLPVMTLGMLAGVALGSGLFSQPTR